MKTQYNAQEYAQSLTAAIYEANATLTKRIDLFEYRLMNEIDKQFTAQTCQNC